MTVSDLKKYKDNLYSSLCRDLSEFEKNFLFISAGLLAFSITFIKEIIKIDEAKFLFLLFLAWSFIIMAIGLMMFTFLKSVSASDKLWLCVDNLITQHELYDENYILSKEQNIIIKNEINNIFYKSKSLLKKLRYISVSIFLIGLIIFATFIAINLLQEKKTNSKPKSEKTLFIKINSLEFLFNDTSLNLRYEDINKFSIPKT